MDIEFLGVKSTHFRRSGALRPPGERSASPGRPRADGRREGALPANRRAAPAQRTNSESGPAASRRPAVWRASCGQDSGVLRPPRKPTARAASAWLRAGERPDLPSGEAAQARPLRRPGSVAQAVLVVDSVIVVPVLGPSPPRPEGACHARCLCRPA